MNDIGNRFYTPKGYERKNNRVITASMEDYLEMICRFTGEDNFVRVNFLAQQLNVKPSSSSKMVVNLRDLGLVEFERYGNIKPTTKGWEIGKYLLHRHKVLCRFFCLINDSASELEQVEQIEHFINKTTIKNIEKLVNVLESGEFNKSGDKNMKDAQCEMDKDE